MQNNMRPADVKLLLNKQPGNAPMFSRFTTLIFFILFALTFIGTPTDSHASATETESEELGMLLGEFWEDFLARSPITATGIGDPRYNDLFPHSLTEEWRIETKVSCKRCPDCRW